MSYCQYCGTKLEDGQTCTCEATKGATNPQPALSHQNTQAEQQSSPVQTTTATPNRASVFLKNVKAYLRAYIANPFEAVRTETDKNSMSVPIILTVVRLLAMGLAIYGLLSKICEKILTAFNTVARRSMWIEPFDAVSVSIPLEECLLSGALMAAVGMILFIAMLFLLVKVQRGNATLGTTFKASTYNGVLTTSLLLLAFVLSFVSIKVCIVFIAITALSWIICGVLTAFVVSSHKTSGIFWLLYIVGVVLVIVGGCYVMPTMFFDAVGEVAISYAGQTITLQSIFDMIGTEWEVAWEEITWEDVLEDIIYDFF